MQHRPRPVILLVAAVVAVLAVPGLAQEPGYHSFADVRSALETWAGEHPDLVELETIGRSAAGAPLLVARVAAAGDVDPDRRPAVFVGANIAGFHNAGTEAALHLVENLVANAGDPLLAAHTFYVAPVLNPDAHDAMFRTPRQRLAGNGATWSGSAWANSYGLDRDLDGLDQEDGPNDLNGDGLITRLRIADPEGSMIPDPDDPRLMIAADPLEGQTGMYRVLTEGYDDDGDGAFNEDGPGGIEPARNFAHAYEYDRPEAGPWASSTPEAQAIMDFLLGRRNVAVAAVFGPANNLLATPRGFGGGGDTGTLKLKVPERIARFTGLDPEEEYTIDEVWERVKTLPFVVQNNISKEQILQFLGAGPATKLEDADVKYLEKLAEGYKERLDEAGLDSKRDGEQYGRGGFTPWLYYQYGVMALELDVWGVPKAKKAEDGDGDKKLTLDSLAEMSSEEFVALGEEEIAAFLKEIGAPPQFNAAAVIQRVQSGQVTPEQMAQMAKRMGGGSAEKEEGGPNDLMVFVDENAPDALVGWTPVTLPDGTEGEVGGVEPFLEVSPPYSILQPALAPHTATVLDLAARLARVEILKLQSTDLGGGVYRVEAVAGNRGFFPTHTKMAQRARSHLPVRLEISLGDGAELVTGRQWVLEERLVGQTGTMSAEWLVRVKSSAEVVVEVLTEHAGHDRATLVVGGRS